MAILYGGRRPRSKSQKAGDVISKLLETGFDAYKTERKRREDLSDREIDKMGAVEPVKPEAPPTPAELRAREKHEAWLKEQNAPPPPPTPAELRERERHAAWQKEQGKPEEPTPSELRSAEDQDWQRRDRATAQGEFVDYTYAVVKAVEESGRTQTKDPKFRLGPQDWPKIQAAINKATDNVEKRAQMTRVVVENWKDWFTGEPPAYGAPSGGDPGDPRSILLEIQRSLQAEDSIPEE